MNLKIILGSLLLGSAISLFAGTVILLYYDLVPIFLIELTIVAVLILLGLSYPVFKGNALAFNIATALGVLAPLLSLSTPDHVAVLLSFGQNALVSILGLLQFLGFYLFPIAFVILRIAYRKKLSPLASSKFQKETETRIEGK